MEYALIEAERGAADSRLRIVRYPGGGEQRSHAHANSSITLVLRGRILEHVGRATGEAEPLSVIVKPAGTVHSDAFAERTETIQILLSARDDAALCGGGMRDWRCEHAPASARAMLKLAMLATRARPSAAGSFDDLLVELIAAIARGGRAERSPVPRWLGTAREALAAGGSTRDAARASDVHPVTLARRFRDCYGETPSAFRGRLRAGRAAALLVSADAPLADTAFASGYADQPHMTRDLGRRFGVSPMRLRRLAHFARG
jgi:AraC-like DNA-binding protein